MRSPTAGQRANGDGCLTDQTIRQRKGDLGPPIRYFWLVGVVLHRIQFGRQSCDQFAERCGFDHRLATELPHLHVLDLNQFIECRARTRQQTTCLLYRSEQSIQEKVPDQILVHASSDSVQQRQTLMQAVANSLFGASDLLNFLAAIAPPRNCGDHHALPSSTACKRRRGRAQLQPVEERQCILDVARNRRHCRRRIER